MKLRKMYVVIGVLTLVFAGVGQAVPSSVSTSGADFSALLGGSAVALNSVLTSNFAGTGLSGTVDSQAFGDGAGNYLYLYQINNSGTSTELVIRFTASPYTGADNSIVMGYLTGSIPAGFTLGDQTPLYGDVDAAAGPTVGFNFPVGNSGLGIPDSFIVPGESSTVLYAESSLAPIIVTGNVIDGTVHSVQVYGPVPEPATICLLGLGGLLLGSRKQKKQR